MRCCDFTCPNIDCLSGYCRSTACIKHDNIKIYPSNNINFTQKIIIFPQTIGNIKFHNYEELIKWVEDQRQINKDPDYGIGIHA